MGKFDKWAGRKDLTNKLNALDTAASAATTTKAGTVKKLAAQTDSAAADVAALKTDFNALLAKLRTAGLM